MTLVNKQNPVHADFRYVADAFRGACDEPPRREKRAPLGSHMSR